MRVVSSWSGGKDSCLACYEAIANGFEVTYLVNLVSEEHDRVWLHEVKPYLMELQAQLARIPVVHTRIRKDNNEAGLKEAILKLREEQVQGMVFGDIALQESRSRNERICQELGIEPIFPLWGKSREQILDCFISAGFEAIVTCTPAEQLGKEWVGRCVDRGFISDLRKVPGIDLCGENGEYHTLATAGPLFEGEIKILKATKRFTDAYNGYWLLDIHECKVNS